MSKKGSRKAAGFGIVEVIIIVAAVVLVGFVGWRVYEAIKSKPTTGVSTTNQSASNSNQTGSEHPTSDPYAGWKTYMSSVAGYSVKYPSDWTIRTSSGDYESAFITSPDKFEVRLDSFARDSSYGVNTLATNPTGTCGATCLATSTLKTFSAPKYGSLAISADKQGAGGGTIYSLDLLTASGSFYVASPAKASVTTTVSGTYRGWTPEQQTQETLEQFTDSSSVKTAQLIYESLAY